MYFHSLTSSNIHPYSFNIHSNSPTVINNKNPRFQKLQIVFQMLPFFSFHAFFEEKNAIHRFCFVLFCLQHENENENEGFEPYRKIIFLFFCFSLFPNMQRIDL